MTKRGLKGYNETKIVENSREIEVAQALDAGIEQAVFKPIGSGRLQAGGRLWIHVVPQGYTLSECGAEEAGLHAKPPLRAFQNRKQYD